MNDKVKDIELVELAEVMATRQGRNTLSRLMTSAGVDVDNYCRDAFDHAYHAGERAFALKLRDNMKLASPDMYLRLVKESMNG